MAQALTPREASARKRRVKAINMRILGKTYQQIADELYNGSASNARKDIMRALEKDYTHDVAELFKIEDARLEQGETAAFRFMMEARSSAIKLGDIDDVRLSDEQIEARSTAADKAAARFAMMSDRFLKFAERRAKMHGLDKPIDVAISGGFDTVVLDPAVAGTAGAAAAAAAAAAELEAEAAAGDEPVDDDELILDGIDEDGRLVADDGFTYSEPPQPVSRTRTSRHVSDNE